MQCFHHVTSCLVQSSQLLVVSCRMTLMQLVISNVFVDNDAVLEWDVYFGGAWRSFLRNKLCESGHMTSYQNLLVQSDSEFVDDVAVCRTQLTFVFFESRLWCLVTKFFSYLNITCLLSNRVMCSSSGFRSWAVHFFNLFICIRLEWRYEVRISAGVPVFLTDISRDFLSMSRRMPVEGLIPSTGTILFPPEFSLIRCTLRGAVGVLDQMCCR
jgi:hypothetical protein